MVQRVETHHNVNWRTLRATTAMFALGQKQTYAVQLAMSAMGQWRTFSPSIVISPGTEVRHQIAIASLMRRSDAPRCKRLGPAHSLADHPL